MPQNAGIGPLGECSSSYPCTVQSCYSRDYYTEGDVMLGVPELAEAVLGFRVYYRCAVDPTFECPL